MGKVVRRGVHPKSQRGLLWNVGIVNTPVFPSSLALLSCSTNESIILTDPFILKFPLYRYQYGSQLRFHNHGAELLSPRHEDGEEVRDALTQQRIS